jgi:hypothetical protein
VTSSESVNPRSSITRSIDGKSQDAGTEYSTGVAVSVTVADGYAVGVALLVGTLVPD